MIPILIPCKVKEFVERYNVEYNESKERHMIEHLSIILS
jgi:hypothetical protein